MAVAWVVTPVLPLAGCGCKNPFQSLCAISAASDTHVCRVMMVGTNAGRRRRSRRKKKGNPSY